MRRKLALLICPELKDELSEADITRRNLNRRLEQWEIDWQANHRAITRDIRVHNSALARAIAKLDPWFGVPEDDPARVAASRKLEDEIIARLYAEQDILRDKRLEP